MHASFPPYTRPASAAPVSAISDTEAKIRTALSYLHHAQLLMREVLGDAPSARKLYEVKGADDARFDRQPPNCDAFARDDEATGL